MRFEVRRNANRVQTILVVAAAFAVFSVLAFVLGGQTTGTTLLVASGVILVFFSLEQGKAGWYYEIGDSALTVRRTFKKYTIPAATLEKARTIGWSGIRERVERYRTGSVAGGNRQVALGRLIGFSAVSIPVKGPQPKGRDTFVLLHRTDGREHILSPADPNAFLKECQRLIARGSSGGATSQ
ncbi:MAG: hypothetical protein PF508_01475 [Spirochaeta sp.]|jgi:hypothetical protein|nr:hypothetical protein [Spirochaeta sp.]